MVSKLVKYSNHYRIYGVNQWQDYTGAKWSNLSAVQYPDNKATYSNPLGKSSSSSYRPKSLFFQFNRSFDDTKYVLDKSYVVVHIKKTSANAYPTVKAFVGNANTPYNSKPKCTVKSPEKVVKDDEGWGVHAYYKLSGISLASFKKLIVELDWSKTTSSGKSEVRVGWVGINVYIKNKSSNKISLSQKLSSENILLGEKVTWAITATQTGDNGKATYNVNIPSNCKVVSEVVTNGTYNNGVWTVNLTKGKSSVLTISLQPYAIGYYECDVKSSNTLLLSSSFDVSEPPIDEYGINYTFYNDVTVRNTGYFDVRICGETNTTLEKHYNLTALLNNDYDVLTNPLYKTAIIMEDSYNVNELLDGESNINFNLIDYGKYCLHLKIPVWSWNDGLVSVECDGKTGVFEILPLPINTFIPVASKNHNKISVMSIFIGSPTEWTIRAKASKHNFMRINDETLSMTIEEPPAYIGCVRLSRGHSADVTASVSNSLIEDRYRNRVYMGKAGDYSEDISMKLRIPPEDVATLEGLAEFDKPVPIDTIPELWDGNPLNHRGWAELHKINNIKKINERLYDCEPVVKYLTHEINTEFTCIKDKAVYPAKEDSVIYPIINTYLVNTHAYGDKLSNLFNISPQDFYSDEETVDDEYVGVYEIPPNNSMKFISDIIQPYGNWDFKFRNTLPSLLSEDYDNNWKMAIRLRDSLTNNVLFEHLYHDYQHFDNNGKVANKCKVTDTFFNGVNYEVIDYSDMYLTKDNFAPLIDSKKKPVIIRMDDTIKPFDNDNIYPDDVEYSVYRIDPSEYDNYDVVTVINVPEGVDIYDIPETDPVDVEAYYTVTRYLSRKKITDHDDVGTTFNLMVKDSTQYVANKKVKITVTDEMDYTESWVKLTDLYGRVSINMNYDNNRYSVYVDFDESEEYRSASALFFIDVGFEDYTDTLFEYDNPERFITYDDTYTVQLIDIGGNSLSDKDVYYSFSNLNNTQYTSENLIVTDGDGKINIPVLYNNGTQHLKVHFKGDDTYNPCIFTELIVIDRPNNNYTIEADDMDYNMYDTNRQYSGLVTYNGSPVSNQEVVIKTYNDNQLITQIATTNSNGVFNVDLNLTFGLWYVDIIIYGDDEYSTTYITRTINVNVETAKDTVFSYDKEFNLSLNGTFPDCLYYVTLTTDNGVAVPYAKVIFEILNNDLDTIQTTTVTANENGVAYCPYYSESDDVTVNFSYDGGLYYNGATGSARIYHANNSASATGEWSVVRDEFILSNTSGIITQVQETNNVLNSFIKNNTAMANIDTMVVVNDIVSYNKTKTINNLSYGGVVGQPSSTIKTKLDGAIYLPPLGGTRLAPKTYNVKVYYKDSTGTVKGGMYSYTITQNKGDLNIETTNPYSQLSISEGDGDTVAELKCKVNSVGDSSFVGEKVSILIESPRKQCYAIVGDNNEIKLPIMKEYLKTCGGSISVTSAKIWIPKYESEPTINNIELCGKQSRTKTKVSYTVTGFSNGAIQTPTITTSNVNSYDIELISLETYERYSLTITPSDDGITKPKLLTPRTGEWLINILFNNVDSNYGEDVYTTIIQGGEITSLFSNSLPIEDGRIVIDPDDNMGETFGSDVSLKLRNGVVSLIDYGLVIDNEALTGGKIFIDNKQLTSQSLICEVEISYDNVHSQRINPLEGLLQVNTLENVQVDSSEINKYQNLICSPSPVPDNHCIFTRHTNEGTLYYYTSKVLDEVNNIVGVKYIGCPYNQFKGGTNLKSEKQISLFSLENGISPVFLDNGLLMVGFHRYSGYVELHRYDEVSDSYFFVNALKIANNPKLKLKENGYSDDKITVLFGDTEWTMWRGKPYVEVKHKTTDMRLLNLTDRVTCEVTENSKSMGFIDDVDIYLGKFTPFSSVQEFKKELHIGENIKTDNFSVECLEEDTYNILDDVDNTIIKEVVDGTFTKDKALKVVKEESGYTGICFPSNGSYVAKPSNTFSLLVQNIYGENLPIAVKCRGYTTTSQTPEKGSTTQVGVWENIQTIDPEVVSTIGDVTNYRFTCTWNNVPNNVNYIDFILVFDEETEVIFNQIMLYEGEKGMNYSKDDSLQKAAQTEIYFDKTYYANLYNEKDNYGLSIIRPHRTSFSLNNITASEITVLAPYMKLSKPHDKVDKLILEYVNSYDQVISIENIGGYI